MKFFSSEAVVLCMEWIFLFTLSSKDELEALSNFMLLQERKIIQQWNEADTREVMKTKAEKSTLHKKEKYVACPKQLRIF